MDTQFALVVNTRSGSFAPDIVETLLARVEGAGLGPTRAIALPDDPLPTAGDLPDGGVVAIYGGDGTCNSVIHALGEWGGAVLVLPGGTMNLGSKRLHGDIGWEEILDRHLAGRTRRLRPHMIRTAHGDALAGVMAGPGATWNDVREAMRDHDIAGMVSKAIGAFKATDEGANIVLDTAPLDRAEGYPMIEALACEAGLEVSAYHADDAGEFVIGLGALLMRQFREGPHDSVTTQGPVTVRSADGTPVGLLLDGEPVPASPEVELTLVRSPIDLISTRTDD